MSTSAAAASRCRNCGAAAHGKYCPECGQETAVHPPSALEFLHEFIGHYVALEGALWRTLKALVVPGRLTLEYFAGRRRHYVLPLRLYLTASVVFFLVARSVTPLFGPQVVTPVTVSVSTAGVLHCDASDASCTGARAFLDRHFPGMTLAQVRGYVMQRLARLFPYAMFLLVPAFAFLTRLAYWNRPLNYGEHLVFALHVHAFAFFVGALLEPIRGSLLAIPAAIYLGLAAKKVFGGRTAPTVLRFLFVFAAYFVLLNATLTAIVLATLPR